LALFKVKRSYKHTISQSLMFLVLSPQADHLANSLRCARRRPLSSPPGLLTHLPPRPVWSGRLWARRPGASSAGRGPGAFENLVFEPSIYAGTPLLQLRPSLPVLLRACWKPEPLGCSEPLTHVAWRKTGAVTRPSFWRLSWLPSSGRMKLLYDHRCARFPPALTKR
jgi:hypothetical protein